MLIDFVYSTVVYHIGTLVLSGGTIQPKTMPPTWHYEYGLFSVSLNPEAWRVLCGASGIIYELSVSDRKFRFVDADKTLEKYADRIKVLALQLGIITEDGENIKGTSLLHLALGIDYPSFMPLPGRTNNEQFLQASLAVLASGDASIDGIWMSDVLGGGMNSERGGIYHLIIPNVQCCVVQAANTNITLDLIIEESDILDIPAP